MKHLIIGALLALSLTDALVASAQESEPLIPTPLYNSRPIITKPAVFVSGEQGESEVTLQAGTNLLLDPNSYPKALQLGFEASAPLNNKGDSPTTVGSLDGLGAGARVKLSIAALSSGRRAPEAVFDEWCEENLASLKEVTGNEQYQCTEFDLNDLTERSTDTDERRSDKKELRRSYRSDVSYYNPFFINVNGELGEDDIDYLDSETLEEESESVQPFSVGFDIGGFIGRNLIAAGLKYQVTYKEGDEIDACIVRSSSDGALECRSGSLDEPQKNKSFLLVADVNRFITSRFAINPQATYNLDEDEYSLQLQLYFVPDESGGLIGGIVPGWDSEEEDFFLKVFIGKAFGLNLPD